MSIIWGSWQNTSSNGMRIGYRVSRTSVSHSSGSVTFTVRIYTQNRYPFADNQHIDFGSYLGSRHSFYNGSSGGAVLRTTRTYRYNYSDYGRSRTLTSSARVGGVWSGLTPSVTIRLSVPARPYARPLTPSNFRVTNQTSNTARLSWTNRRDTSGGRPYSSQRIEYSYYHSSGSWTGWSFAATVSGGASWYDFSPIYNNSRYQFRIRANNSAGSSSWNEANDNGPAVNTVPNAPTNARARVQPSGDEIRITWTRNNQRDDGVIFHQIQRQTSSGGSWSTVASRLSAGSSSWIDESPNSGYNRYRVRSFLDSPLRTQYSSWSTAPAITTIVPPLAPTGLRIQPRVPDFTRETTITWEHRDGGDGAAQSRYEISYSPDGGDTWEATGSITSTESSHTFEPGALQNGVDYLFRIRTRGNIQEGFGPWSAEHQSSGWTTPTVSLIEDEPSGIVQTIPFNVAWLYNQDEDRDQLSAEVEIWGLDDDGHRVNRVVREALDGADSSLEIEHILEDGREYLLRVRATSSREQTSSWDERLIFIDLLPPARADLRPQYDSDTGVMVLEVEPRSPRYGSEIARNVVHDPNFANGQLGPWTAYTNQLEITQSFSQMWGDRGGYKLQHTNTSNAWFNGARHAPFAMQPGQWLGLRALVATESWCVAHFRVQWLDQAGSEISADDSDRISAGWYDGAEIEAVFEAPDGTAQARVNIFQRRNSGTLEGGERLWIGRVAFIIADSESSAIEHSGSHFDGSSEPTESHAFRWAGAPNSSPSIKYELIDEAEEGAEPFEAGIEKFSVQRRVNDGSWVTIIEDVEALDVDEGEDLDGGAHVISLMDLLPAINGRNEYRLHLRSYAPSVADTDPIPISVTPAMNQGWTFLNYGPDMGSVLRVGNAVTVAESLEVDGEDQPLAGRKRPVSLYGEHETRVLSVDASVYHDELEPAPSSQSPLDSPPEDWRMAQREANTVCLRTPSGHRIYGRMSGLNLSSSNLNVSEMSFSVTENDFDESESTGAGVEVMN